MSSDPAAKIEDATAWAEFCELLKKAGDVLLREDLDTDLFDRAEGHRYLARLLRAGLFSFVENPGPLHPVFRAMPEMVKMGLDNPDNYYVSASVNPSLDYRIRGRRGTIHYLSFAAQNQNFAAKDKITGGVGHLNDSELELADDGLLRDHCQPERSSNGNWLQDDRSDSPDPGAPDLSPPPPGDAGGRRDRVPRLRGADAAPRSRQDRRVPS